MINDVRSFVMGPTPIFARLLDWLQWRQIIDGRVGRADFKVSIGTRVEALLVNIHAGRKALYKVQEFYEKQDVETVCHSTFVYGTLGLAGARKAGRIPDWGRSKNVRLVYSLGICSGANGYGLLDSRLCLPKVWFDDKHEALRAKCDIPEETEFRTNRNLR